MATSFEVIELGVLHYTSDGRTYYMDEDEGDAG